MVDLNGLHELVLLLRQDNTAAHDELKALITTQNGRISALERWRAYRRGATRGFTALVAAVVSGAVIGIVKLLERMMS